MGASWDAYKASWRVLRADPELLLIPPLGILLVVLLLPLLGGAWYFGIPLVEQLGWPEATLLVVFIPYAWLMVMVTSVLEALVVVTAQERLQGGEPTFGRSLGKVGRCLGRLALWSLLMAFVISLLAVIRRKGRLGRSTAFVGGVAVSLATLFVVPHLVLQGVGVRDALRTSGTTIRRRFGPVTGRVITFGLFGAAGFLGLVFGGLILLNAASLFADHLSTPVVIAILVTPVTLGLVFLTLHGIVSAIYKTALYESVVHDRLSVHYPENAMIAPFE